MEGDEVPLDDKAKRMRDLLSSFYAIDSSSFPTSNRAHSFNASGRYATLDTINTASFDADRYMNLLVNSVLLNVLDVLHVSRNVGCHKYEMCLNYVNCFRITNTFTLVFVH